MRKVVAVLWLLSVLGSLAGCGRSAVRPEVTVVPVLEEQPVLIEPKSVEVRAPELGRPK